jgi:hypothetical protein
MVNRPTRLASKTNAAATPVSRTSKAMEAEQQFESSLSQEQLQALEQENNSLLEGFERTLDQIKCIHYSQN